MVRRSLLTRVPLPRT